VSFPLSPLALRIALVVAAAGAGAALLAGAAGVHPAVAGIIVGAATGAAGYSAVRRRVVRRLAAARAALGHARGPGDAAPTHGGSADDLDALVDDARDASASLQREVARLEHLADYRRSFLGDVSHELRTPIFAISGFAESLLDGALDDESVRRRFVEKILTNARRLDALTRDLAEIARIESGELRMRVAVFDPAALVRESVEAVELVAAERGVTLNTDLPTDLPRAEGDRARLQQVLTNLIENGVKYNDRGGHVTVSAQREPDGVAFTVDDDGIGIAPEDVPRVTERFYRVDRSRSRAEGGTGLGLSIAKHILEAHGSRLRIDSRPGAGSTFAFTMRAGAPDGNGGTA